MSKNFALLGAAGYIAPRHFQAIKETGNELLVALDKTDSVGILDSYFPKADFFTEYERFDRHVEKLRHEDGSKIDFVSICTPNYLHDSHIRFALKNNADAICEKPLVLNPWNIDALQRIQEETGNKVYNILQLRLHDDIIALKKKIDAADTKEKYEVDLTYLTSRGSWYYTSWKGDISKSGGIATNIGIHFFDMLMHLFGDVQMSEIHINTHDRAGGYMELKNARVRWFLSINEELLPEDVVAKGQRTFRSITVNGDEIEFSKGFTDLHTKSYQHILDGHGFQVEEARRSINFVQSLRTEIVDVKGKEEIHPLCLQKLSKHPFKV